jgi:hypothetical protein
MHGMRGRLQHVCRHLCTASSPWSVLLAAALWAVCLNGVSLGAGVVQGVRECNVRIKSFLWAARDRA